MSAKPGFDAHTGNTYEDFSGVAGGTFDNPYDALIAASQDDPRQMQERYSTHRTMRNAQQKEKLLSSDFDGFKLDSILQKLEDPAIEPGYEDPRHCLVFWGRPTQKVKEMISNIQQELRTIAPNLWLMPSEKLHITCLEITHSKTAVEIDKLVDTLEPKRTEIVDFTHSHRARLIKPMLGYDAAAVALSFLPAAGEALSDGRSMQEDAYTYHHLRRDLYTLCSSTGVKVDSRYVVPSAHLTIGRFIDASDFAREGGSDTSSPDAKKVKALVDKLEEINERLQKECWPDNAGGSTSGKAFEWIVGQEKGLSNRKGTLWYGGGEEIMTGKGF